MLSAENFGAFVLPAAASVHGVGLGCPSVATEGLGKTSVPRPSHVGNAGEVSKEGLTVHWLNHR